MFCILFGEIHKREEGILHQNVVCAIMD